jgi:hypothetical protein
MFINMKYRLASLPYMAQNPHTTDDKHPSNAQKSHTADGKHPAMHKNHTLLTIDTPNNAVPKDLSPYYQSRRHDKNVFDTCSGSCPPWQTHLILMRRMPTVILTITMWAAKQTCCWRI